MQNATPLRIGHELEGEAVAYDGARLQFVVPKAFPPGQPIEVTLLLSDSETLTLQLRSLGSKRRDDARFDVQARLVSLSRPARAALERAFNPAARTTPS